MKAGLEKVVDVARRAGIPESVEMVASPSVSLGAASPHVIDLANAYATFAAQGVYENLLLLMKFKDLIKESCIREEFKLKRYLEKM